MLRIIYRILTPQIFIFYACSTHVSVLARINFFRSYEEEYIVPIGYIYVQVFRAPYIKGITQAKGI